jgi:hypothetical protein
MVLELYIMEKEISEKQLEANRENSKLGGVKTDEGKTISKMNALKHGLLSSQVLLEGEEGSKLTELELSVREQFLPVGEFEFYLVDRIIANIWRLRRLIKIEGSIMEYEKNDAFASLGVMGQGQLERKNSMNMLRNNLIDRVMRYEVSLERSIFKSLHELQRIQSIRGGEKVITPIVLDVDITKKDDQNGFVS